MNAIRKPPKDVHALSDQSNDKGYFTITPRIVLAMCRNPFDLALWLVVKDVAGESRECYIGAVNLGKLAMMSPGQVRNSRTYLLGVGLLCGEKRNNGSVNQDVWHLWIPDLWSDNLKWCEEYRSIESRITFKNRQKIEPADPLQPTLIEQALPFIDDGNATDDSSPSTPCQDLAHSARVGHTILGPSTLCQDPSTLCQDPSTLCQDLAHSDLKEEQGEQLKQKEQEHFSPTKGQPDYVRLWDSALKVLEIQMTGTTFRHFLRETEVSEELCNGKLVIRLMRPKLDTLPMIENRLRPMIERAVRDAAGREIVVEFVARQKGSRK